MKRHLSCHDLVTQLNRRRFLLKAGAVAVALPLLGAGQLEAASHRVNLSIVGFGSGDKAIVESAFWIAMERCFKSKVVSLAAKNSNRSRGPAHDVNDPDDDVTYRKVAEAKDAISAFVVWAMADMLGSKGGDNPTFNFELTIKAADLGGNLGQAEVGLSTVWGYHQNDSSKRRRFAIELDKAALKARDKQDTAGTIWHEMLHNAGLTHGSGQDYAKNYEGYIIKEWGLAVAADGVAGFGLADRDPYARRGCG